MALNVHPNKTHGVYRLMRILTHSGFFGQERIDVDGEEESYSLTLSSRLLLKHDTLSTVPFLQVMLDPILTEPWHFLSTWFQNDDLNCFVVAHGKTIWEYASHVPRLNHFLNDGMESDANLVSRVLIKECKSVFEGVSSLVDVGGGTGKVAKAIADAFPNMKCTVFDQPHVVAGLQDTENLNYLGGDMFLAIPPADAILLKWILHDWSDEESINILKRCKEAIMGKGGKIIIIDMTVENQKWDKESTQTQLFFDMLMLALATGKERTKKEWAKLFSDAGFNDYKVTHLLGLRSLIEVYP